MMIRYRYDLGANNGVLSELHINKKLITMLKIMTEEYLHLNSTNFGGLKYFRSDNSVGFYCKLLNFISKNDKRSMKLESDEFYCVDKNGNRIAGCFLLIKEKRIVDRVPTEDIYFCYINDDGGEGEDLGSSEDLISSRKKIRFTEKQDQTFKRLLGNFKGSLPTLKSLCQPRAAPQENKHKIMMLHGFLKKFYTV